jgi:predicted DNA-binding WGR domain protein
MNQGIRLRWEKPTARGVCYYEVDLHQDLWSEWLLIQAWGRRGTRLGQIRVAPCGSRDEGLARIAVILKRRRQRRYHLVAGADPNDNTF